MENRLLTPEEVARQLRVTQQTVYNWLQSGRLPGIKMGRLWRIDPADLDRWKHNARAGEGPRPLRAYSREEVREFLESDRLDPATAAKVERLLRP
jgi:excisionase family DNA binding protein